MILKYYSISKENFAHFKNIMEYAEGSLDAKILPLVYLLVAQLNKCPYCVDAHFKEGLKVGIEPRKMNSILVFKETIFFSKEEIAILNLTEKITLLSGEYSKEIEELKAFLAEKQIVDLVFAISNMNALTRIAIAFENKPIY